MDQESSEAIATERARWFSELSVAIDQAQKVAWRLGVSEGDCAEAMELYARLEAVREEVDALRRGVWEGEQSQLEPFWINLLPWRPQAIGAGE